MILNDFNDAVVQKLLQAFPEVQRKGGIQIIHEAPSPTFFVPLRLPGITLRFGVPTYRPERTIDPMVLKDIELLRGEAQQWHPYDYDFTIGLHTYEARMMNDWHERLLSVIGPHDVIGGIGVDLQSSGRGEAEGLYFRSFDYLAWIMLKGHVKEGYLVSQYEIQAYHGLPKP